MYLRDVFSGDHARVLAMAATPATILAEMDYLDWLLATNGTYECARSADLKPVLSSRPFTTEPLPAYGCDNPPSITLVPKTNAITSPIVPLDRGDG